MRGVGTGRRGIRAGAMLLAALLVLGACAVDRSAMRPGTAAPAVAARSGSPAASSPAPVRARLPAGPMTANQLARRMGLVYQDAPSHVLLSDDATRVRIWKDSNEVSVSGRVARLPARSRRQGTSLIVPAQTVTYVQNAVNEERKRLVSYRAYEPKSIFDSLPPLEPFEAAPAPAPLPPRKPLPALPPAHPAHVTPPGDPAWAMHARPARHWTWIIIHHSDDTSGDLAKYDRIHVQSNGWDECGYHFVIGNGSLSRDGQVEIGSRWRKQKYGAHTKDPQGDNRYNEHGIGICLVGNFEEAPPTRAQMDSLVRLCRWLMANYGIQPEDVIGHSDCKPTRCPGRYFPWAELRRRL